MYRVTGIMIHTHGFAATWQRILCSVAVSDIYSGLARLQTGSRLLFKMSNNFLLALSLSTQLAQSEFSLTTRLAERNGEP